MAAPSYRLEAPRARPPPLPIRTHNLSPKSSALTGISSPTETLLYDLPSSPLSGLASPSRHTSPTSPRPRNSPNRLTSPTSPRSRDRNSRLMSPPPRSVTPSAQPVQGDLEAFAEQCRAWYYEQDDNAGRRMTQTLATLPPAQRAPFSRLQASIRSAFHASVNARRHAEFKAHLSTTKPGGSLMPVARASPRGAVAKKERYDRLDRFIRTWCTEAMPGTKPFFLGLWAVMRLQVIPLNIGGAGPYRIEWEIDDAVFKESGGKEFMLEAIDVLKGVLAFEETMSPLSRASSTTTTAPGAPFAPLSQIHSRSQSQPLTPTGRSGTAKRGSPIASTTATKRIRAPSDPFLDSPTADLAASYSSVATSATKVNDDAAETPTKGKPSKARTLGEPSESDGFMRTWTAPDLPNPEYLALLGAFPPFIARSTLTRFAVPGRAADLEEGERLEDKRISMGTGAMWLGHVRRADGWQGGWWTRFKLWLARVLR